MSAQGLSLVKAHAYGNDFLLADAAHVPDQDLSDLARRACDRHRGVGADGLMLVAEHADRIDTRLFNADGGEAEISGNGVRCAAAWVAARRQLKAGATLDLGTVAGVRRLELQAVAANRFTFRADMGTPEGLTHARVEVNGTMIDAVTLRMGNPQCVVLGEASLDRLQTIAAPLAVHPAFPEGTNVELAEVQSPGRVRILIWERGVGPTEASGTGACAAAVAAAFASGASRTVEVVAPGGTQLVEWTDVAVWLTGWAELVGRVEWWLA